MKCAAVLLTTLIITTACNVLKIPNGQPAADSQVIPPEQITDFSVLYGQNCSGCHGENGRGGAAVGLGDPLYLAIADDATIRRITSNGVSGTAMSAFSQSSGGFLTQAQIEAIVHGIRNKWAQPKLADSLHPPSYSSSSPGDAKRGSAVYAVYCQSCHGPEGRGGPKASSIVDGSFLTLVSDQSLRTTVIVGRPELGAPDWRGDVPDKPMSPEDIADVVAWLAAQRPQTQAQANATLFMRQPQ
jgi:mono/diheme cytochrome c family protein